VVLLALPSLFALTACAGNRPGPRRQPTTRLGYAPLLARIDGGDAEARYHATLALGRHDSRVVKARLQALLEHEDVLTQNAAARALVALGEEDAAGTLIANLHRDRRTYMVTDAIHHLAALYGTDRGYEPNLGYRHQTEAQARWAAWFEARGHVLVPEPAHPDAASFAALHEALAPRVAACVAEPAGDDPDAWVRAAALWKDLGELGPSREPAHVALVAEGFGALAERWPDQAPLWNNHALASLSDGRYENAERAYRKALALLPEDAYLHNDFGILLEGLGRLAEAEALYREAIRLDPQDDVWRTNLGDVLRQQGRTAEAIAAYREAERLAPEKWYYHRLWIGRLRGAP
jgi:tetratricopeptide (TPR) repeat protein